MENTKKIDDNVYTVTPFLATVGYRLGRRIAALSTNPFTALDKLIESDEDLSLTCQLLSVVMQDGKAINKSNFDVCFDGKLSHIPIVLAYVVEVNLSSFLATAQDEFLKVVKPILEKLEKEMKN